MIITLVPRWVLGTYTLMISDSCPTNIEKILNRKLGREETEFLETRAPKQSLGAREKATDSVPKWTEPVAFILYMPAFDGVYSSNLL